MINLLGQGIRIKEVHQLALIATGDHFFDGWGGTSNNAAATGHGFHQAPAQDEGHCPIHVNPAALDHTFVIVVAKAGS